MIQEFGTSEGERLLKEVYIKYRSMVSRQSNDSISLGVMSRLSEKQQLEGYIDCYSPKQQHKMVSTYEVPAVYNSRAFIDASNHPTVETTN